MAPSDAEGSTTSSSRSRSFVNEEDENGAAAAAAAVPVPVPVPSYEDRARPWQHWTLSYLNPLLKLGASRVLNVEDVGRPSKEDAADTVHALLVEEWEKEIRRAEAATERLREKEERMNAGGGGRKRSWRCWGERGVVAAAAGNELPAPIVASASASAATEADAESNDNGGSSSKKKKKKKKKMAKKPKTVEPSLSRALVRAFGPWRIAYGLILLLVATLLTFVPILLLNDLVKYFEATNAGLAYDGMAHPWVEVVGLGLVPVLVSLLQNRHYAIMQHLAVFIRTGCSTLLFRKSLRVSPTGRARTSAGQVVNMMSNDTNVLMRFAQMVGMTLVSPIQIVISLVLIYKQVGNATWVGVGLLLVIVPINGVIFGVVARLRRRVLKHQDARVKMINDILTGIRIIKFYAWEKPFLGEVGRVREDELKALTSLTMVMLVGFSAILFALPIIQIILVFVTYVLTEQGGLTASVAFTTVALFNMMRFPFAILPMGFLQMIQAAIGLQRMKKYLNLPELTEYVVFAPHPDDVDSSDDPDGGGKMGVASITMNECSFTWTKGGIEATKPLFGDDSKKKKRQSKRSSLRRSSLFRRGEDRKNSAATSPANGDSSVADIESSHSSSSAPFLLNDISCAIAPGSLVAVVGEVGCGKSSFLNSLLGEMEAVDGSTKCYIPRGNADKESFVAFCSQTPWVVNNTLRGNIVFGRPFDKDRYDRVVKACALEDDLAILPAGDMTEIGERGIGLSGGQKSRVCLARALYSQDTSVLLLDDPLSAVDAHVGEHIFNQAIVGLGEGATRILVTHHVQFLPRCDWVIIMQEGRIKHQGTYRDLTDQGIDFVGSINVAGTDDSPVSNRKMIVIDKATDGVETQPPGARSDDPDKAGISEGDEHAKLRKNGAVLMIEEGRETESVAREAYIYYTKAGGLIFAFIFVFTQGASKGLEVGSSFWLAKWADDTVAAQAATNGGLSNSETFFYLNIYALLGLLGVGCLVVRGWALAMHRLKSSRKLHAEMAQSILRAPIALFDVTPTGRILNRFSHDMDKIDMELGHVMSQGFNVLFAILGAIGALAAATKGFFLIPLVPLTWVYNKIQKWFRKTSTELQRLFSMTKSPIFADFSQTLAGVSIVRAYGQETRVFDKCRADFDKNSSAYILQQFSFLWIALRLEFLGAFISAFVGALAVGTASTSVSIPAGWLGLALTYSIEVVTYLKYGVRTLATLEADFTSVERVLEFAHDIPPEAADVLPSDPKPGNWPIQGDIVVDNVSMRYREGPLVLKNITFSVNAGEKIGVVGRTGSGKSSLMIAILRIVEIEDDGGNIVIDGVDIGTIGVNALRSSISIIPQESVLFANTVRYNLDPFREKPDAELWEALGKVRLSTMVAAMPAGLDSQVVEGGENFSQGQRQLLCIARSLLRNPKILIMDEATSSIDNETDTVVQEMIRENFGSATVLTIAHRLGTIMDSDRVLVLDDGRIAEYDAPQTLLANSNGIFASMVRKERESRRKNNQ